MGCARPLECTAMGHRLAHNLHAIHYRAVCIVACLCLSGMSVPPRTSCSPPEYYRIDLIPTRRVPAARSAAGVADVAFASSPFGIAISADGHYVYDLSISIRNLRAPSQGDFVAWIATPSLDRIERVGSLSSELSLSGQVSWNKFLVIISLEPSDTEQAQRWQGPIVMRGLSRSGLMHTSAGHGPFQLEPCATFGY